MVQTRSKYRLLQNNSESVVSKEPTQPTSSTNQTLKRKRKRNHDNNDDNAQITTDSTMTVTG